jgi:hypothetical protein
LLAEKLACHAFESTTWHTFACRLRAAGVSAEDREALLGHAHHSMAAITQAPMSVT